MDLEERKTSFKKVFKRLKEVFENTKKEDENYEIFRDSAIQRFEITIEAFWKCVKILLMKKEGVICNSPKGCIRELFLNGYVDENDLEILLKMIDDRNLTSHTYDEEVADEIFQRLKVYLELLTKLEVCL